MCVTCVCVTCVYGCMVCVCEVYMHDVHVCLPIYVCILCVYLTGRWPRQPETLPLPGLPPPAELGPGDTLPSAFPPQNRSLEQLAWLERASPLSVPSICKECCWSRSQGHVLSMTWQKVLCVVVTQWPDGQCRDLLTIGSHPSWSDACPGPIPSPD